MMEEEVKQIPSKKEQIVRLLETKRFNQTEIARQCEVSISYVHKIKTAWEEKKKNQNFADKVGSLSELCRLYQQTTNVSDLLRLTEMIQQKRAEEREVLKEQKRLRQARLRHGVTKISDMFDIDFDSFNEAELDLLKKVERKIKTPDFVTVELP